MRSRLNTALRAALLLTINAAFLMLFSEAFGDFDVGDWINALAITAIITVVNALLWPLVISLALRFVVFTAGIGAILLNGLVLEAATGLVADVKIGLGTAALVAALITFANVIATTILGLGERDLYWERVALPAIRRAARRRGREIAHTEVPGVIFLEIDGLAYEVMRRAVANGHLPTLARWLGDGSHRIVPWECDLSSQTSASQAGLLHGSNLGIPAFRWYEKSAGKLMVSSDAKDVAEIERRLSDGRGLLAQGGTSRGNLLSGDAPRQLLTLSRVREQLYSHDFYAYFADPFSTARTLALSLWDVMTELKEAAAQKRHDIKPRIDRGGVYPLLRVGMTVVMRDFNTALLIGDIIEGVPVSYATFVGYDEVAHHSGVERRDALDVLRRLDQQFARIERVSRLAPRPYEFVVLSDHGQSQGATFKQRFGETLEDVVRGAIGDATAVQSPPQVDEGWGNLSGAVTQAANSASGMTATLVRGATRERTEDGVVALGPERRRIAETDAIEQARGEDTIVMASGNLGLVYLPGPKRRLNRDEIESAHPGLIETLTGHPGVGFVVVAGPDDGSVALGKDGAHHLVNGKVEGSDPLKEYGENAALHLRRHCDFEHTPDLLVMSMYDPVTDEVAAFEELVGSHGGLGGSQSHAFALIPNHWKPHDRPILGAGEMHHLFKRWLADAGTISPDA